MVTPASATRVWWMSSEQPPESSIVFNRTNQIKSCRNSYRYPFLSRKLLVVLRATHVHESQRRCSAVTICSSIGSQFEGRFLVSGFSKPRRNSPPLMMRNSVSSTGDQTARLGLSSRGRNMSLRLSVPSHERVSQISWSMKPANRRKGSASTGLIVGLFVCFAYSEPVKAEIAKRTKTMDDDVDEGKDDSSSASTSHGKKVYTDYSVTGIPGDGRCLFRSVVHGACLRSGKPSTDESLQKELADELRSKVADEFVKRREETEWFVEGDFDTHISKIRQPHVWGGEPELLMASHVLQMPITVYMHDDDSGGLISIAEYGQEYGKDNPIRTLAYKTHEIDNREQIYLFWFQCPQALRS
ncbi:hypothetical protein MRB53_006952 [Persea americana]|uniref:Uncharacterized protein n=1 Tax=Persea americana TaxID=3435 RepID=A0ACC2MHM8_PERAE|nr:hypothetical protein MRB53_006952 [Persea americana]